MSFDETYDEMLHEEFSSPGKHQAEAAAAEDEFTESASPERHAASHESEAVTAARPRGRQRSRTAGLVGAGGLVCAAAGACLGGLGGYFTISPAATHPVAAPAFIQDVPLAQAISSAAHSAGAKGTSDMTAAKFSKVSGSLTKGIAPFPSLASDPFGNLPAKGPRHGGEGSGKRGDADNNTAGGGSGGGGGGGGLAGCASGSSGLDITCILSNLTVVLTNLGSVTGGKPVALLPLPLPGGGIPTSFLGASGAVPLTTGGTAPHPAVGALTPVLNTVGSGTGGLDSTGTAIPSLPLPTTTGATVPNVVPPSTVTATTTPSGGPTSVNVPLPVPAPVNAPPVTIGGPDSTSGLTLTLP